MGNYFISLVLIFAKMGTFQVRCSVFVVKISLAEKFKKSEFIFDTINKSYIVAVSYIVNELYQ